MSKRIEKARDVTIQTGKVGPEGNLVYCGALEKEILDAQAEIDTLLLLNDELRDQVETLEHRCEALEERLENP